MDYIDLAKELNRARGTVYNWCQMRCGFKPSKGKRLPQDVIEKCRMIDKVTVRQAGRAAPIKHETQTELNLGLTHDREQVWYVVAEFVENTKKTAQKLRDLGSHKAAEVQGAAEIAESWLDFIMLESVKV